MLTDFRSLLGKTAGGIIGASAAVYVTPLVIGYIGFSTPGIIAGSKAAWIMSLYGGSPLPGSLVAVLQSIGAAGMGWVATTTVGTTGAVTGALGANATLPAINMLHRCRIPFLHNNKNN